jgi:hypothetical protein
MSDVTNRALERKPKVTKDDTAKLRRHLEQLKARYDHGAVTPAVLGVIRTIETKISWHEHASRQS